MAEFFEDIRWGGVRLWCSRVTTDNSRTQVVHEVAEGDDHPVQDRGLAPRRTTCDLLFVDMPDEPRGPLERFREFKAMVDSDEGPRLLVHPIDGAHYAGVEAFTYAIDEDSNLAEASVVFVRTAPAEADVTPATSAVAGDHAVEARAAELATALEVAGVTSAAPATATAHQAAWSEADELGAQEVINGVAEISEGLGTLIEDLEDDLALWPAYEATIMLGAAVRASAIAALAETPRLTAVRVATPIGSLALAARIYGGAEAETRDRQIRALNAIATPGWIPVGTVVVVPVPTRRR